MHIIVRIGIVEQEGPSYPLRVSYELNWKAQLQFFFIGSKTYKKSFRKVLSIRLCDEQMHSMSESYDIVEPDYCIPFIL